jgi:hypothetical protein
MNLRLHRLAVDEIDHEVDYYESIYAGLGAELEEEIDAVLEMILQVSGCRRAVEAPHRPACVRPVQIIGEDIVVLALAHMRRRPGYWSRRR